MAVDAYLSSQYLGTSAFGAPRNLPIEKHGKKRVSFFTLINDKLSDINTTYEMCKLPEGRVRILPATSRLWCTAAGAGRLLAIGHRAYSDSSNVAVAENPSFIIAALDISAALSGVPINLALAAWKLDLYSKQEKILFATLAGGQTPIGFQLQGWIDYVTE